MITSVVNILQLSTHESILQKPCFHATWPTITELLFMVRGGVIPALVWSRRSKSEVKASNSIPPTADTHNAVEEQSRM